MTADADDATTSKRKGKRVTIKEVAHRAGVSHQTVSRYLRYSGGDSGAPAANDYVNAGLMQALVEENLMDVVVPAFVIADLVSLAIGLALSLYFSRKISVPIYRISKWAEVVSGGDLTFRLKFRPGDDLQTLEDACNRVSDTYAKIIEDLRRQVTEANLPLSPGAASVQMPAKRSPAEA